MHRPPRIVERGLEVSRQRRWDGEARRVGRRLLVRFVPAASRKRDAQQEQE
jgi:hypothetical protein